MTSPLVFYLLLAAAVLAAVMAYLTWRSITRREQEQGGRDQALQDRLEERHQALLVRLEALEKGQENLGRTLREELAASRREAADQAAQARRELAEALEKLGQGLTGAVRDLSQDQERRLALVKDELDKIGRGNEERQERLRGAVEKSLEQLRAENRDKLEQMRRTVEEKLEGTLEKRLGESFRLVSRQLEQVYKSVGEMQNLASGVGDLKRVLTNVKARGTWGEFQLGNLLEQMLTPEQYARNVEIKPRSGQRVEFAIRLPGREEGEGEVWLPIDAKFPIEDYERLLDAAERAEPQEEAAAAKALESRIKSSAKEISQKYLAPPHSTDFAIMYLPSEGLYAEVLRRPGLASQLQRDFRVTVAGPTTLAALLNSLQMGFRSLAIQKRSSEVWQVLGAVKTEFQKYGEVLAKVKKKLSEASNHIEKVEVRQRVMGRKLKQVESLPEERAAGLLNLEPMDLEEE